MGTRYWRLTVDSLRPPIRPHIYSLPGAVAEQAPPPREGEYLWPTSNSHPAKRGVKRTLGIPAIPWRVSIFRSGVSAFLESCVFGYMSHFSLPSVLSLGPIGSARYIDGKPKSGS